MIEKRLYKPKEAAIYLSYSYVTLAKARSDKDPRFPPYVMIGGRPRYDKEDLDNFIATHKRH